MQTIAFDIAAPFALPFCGFFALVVVFVILGAKQAKKRREALAAWAQAHGLSLDTSHDHGFRNRFPQFSCFKKGDQDRYAYNTMAGLWNGRQVIAFYYHYETTSTNSKGHRTTSSWYFSGVLLKPAIPLKPLSIRAENFLDKVAGFFGLDDIDFESAEFSRRFCVNSPDRRWAYDVLHARTIEFLLQGPRFTIEFAPDQVLAWKSGRFRPQQFEQAIRIIEGVLDRLPDYVVQQQQASPEGNASV